MRVIAGFLGEICDIKELFSKQTRYPNLSKLALACVVLPNSNGDSEHIFSMLKKIFQMIAHCLFTSIDSNEKFREIRMRVIAG
jgi:hypothetical protein